MVALPSRPFHWPGGIPTEVKADPNNDITPDEIEEQAKGLEMNLPVNDILEETNVRDEFPFGFDGARDGWEKDIGIYAPGYLEMEATGMEADYDHARLVEPDEAFEI
ncbi:unnamed protein product [Penicillium manginii]